MSRELRRPVGTAEFNRLELRAPENAIPGPVWNLRWAHHARKEDLFFASKSGRLTPSSGTVACLYLGQTEEASFYEIYGDDIDAAEKRGAPFRFSRSTLESRIFLQPEEIMTARLYDLTLEKSAQAIGLDLATLYDAEVEYAREFAQRLHDHPAGFDGVKYLSRHTQGVCYVIWATHRQALREMAFVRRRSLWDLARYRPDLPPGAVRLFSTNVEVSSP